MATVLDKVHPYEASQRVGRPGFKVADLNLAEWGRKEIRGSNNAMLRVSVSNCWSGSWRSFGRI